MTALGGPGVACSTMILRRLEAGELIGDRRARAEDHLAGCARCQAALRDLAAERRVLAAELPFDAFAAGVAERLAAPAPRAPAWRRALPLALAAGLALAAATPLLVGHLRQGALVSDPGGVRVKGGAAAALHVATSGGSRALGPSEPVPAGAPLRLVLSGVGRRHVAAALVDEDGPALLPPGPGGEGAPAAFEWTGRSGRLVVVLDEAPVDGAALLARLRAGEPPAGSATGEVLVLPLARAGR